MKELQDLVLRLMGRKNYTPANAPELLQKLHLSSQDQESLNSALRQLESAGEIARIKGNRYILPAEADLIPGRIRMNKQGKGFLDPDDPELKEIHIPETATGTAMHEDHVLVRLDVRRRGFPASAQGERTGAVVRILERRRRQLVGTLKRGRQFLYVTPDDPRVPHDVLVPEPRDIGRPARVGDKVVVEMADWESRNESPEGEIIEVLGAPDEEGVDMLSVLRQYNLPLHFPKEVLNEARSFGTQINAEDLHGRRDCRNDTVITIDPDDAKDFDDAICLQRRGDQWRLWVHIADVSHYVRPGSLLDEEARKRGNSTYLVDRVIPMLPEALSNELCSLKPEVERLTKCVEFQLSNEGRVLKTDFYSAVIRSRRRFSYQEAFAILQRKPEGPVEQMLHQASQLAQRIRKCRFHAGSLDLDFPEQKIRLDEHGRVLRLEKVVNDISHQLIEEYMLLANEAVAFKLRERKIPSVYRVHEEPSPERLEEFREDVVSHGIQCGNLRKRSEVQRLLAALKTIPEGDALKIGFLKSLMRARYAIEPLGHYGLAKSNYTHFTSPIRRYADLVVHRTLFGADRHASVNQLRQTADHISLTERNSYDAERDSRDVKLFAFLKSQIDSNTPVTYNALVTDLRNFGFFVDVGDLAMSGLIRLSSIAEDFFVLDPDRNQLIGRRTRRTIRLGDRVPVQIFRVDTAKKQVDFKLAAAPRLAAGGRQPAPQERGQMRREHRERGQSGARRQPQPQQQPKRTKSITNRPMARYRDEPSRRSPKGGPRRSRHR